MKIRVVVAMSGGVDSSVAAALLQRQGHEVIGITMCFGLKESNKKRPSCCGIEGIEDARRVAHKLGIKHYVLNFDKFLQEKVIDNFIEEYLSGRTPNPCIRCNQYLKFDALLDKAKGLGAQYLATGHYAKIVVSCQLSALSSQLSALSKKYLLKKGKDKYKDQSYFLYRLKQEQLKQILFPLGDYTKTQVRKIAANFGLPVKDKPGSQEICFVPDQDYRGFLKHELTRMKTRINTNIKPGPILDSEGNILSEHKGIPFYTIGQREGLGIAMGYPVYVTKIDAKNNTIIVGKKEAAFSDGLIAADLSFIDKPMNSALSLLDIFPGRKGGVKREVALKVKIRYNHKEITSKVMPFGKNRIKIIFSKPQFAVCPGQSVVFYKGEEVIGGGIIETALNGSTGIVERAYSRAERGQERNQKKERKITNYNTRTN